MQGDTKAAWAFSLSGFIGAGGLEVSGYENPLLGAVLIFAAIGFAIYGAVSHLSDARPDWPFSQRWNKGRRSWRIPLIDLYERADAKGWNFLSGGNLTVLDFAKAFRQGALDGKIPVWGRAQQALDELTESEPLVPIPEDHWRKHELDAIAVLRYATSSQAVGLTKDNLALRTKTIPESMHHGCFADLYVKRKEAMRWLKRDAREFLGKTEKSDGSW